MKSVHEQLALRKDLGFLPTLAYFDCLSSWAHNLQDSGYQQNDQTRSFYFGKELDQQSKSVTVVKNSCTKACRQYPSCGWRSVTGVSRQ